MPTQANSSTPPSTTAFPLRYVALLRTVVLVIALLLLTRNVTGRFTGLHEWNSAMYSHFARNHIQYGLGYTKLLCTWGDTKEAPPRPQRYLNHPPLIAAWAALPMLIFGDNEWVGRSVPIAATLASALLLMVIVARLHSPALSVLAGLFYVTLPVTAYFGRMFDHTAPVQLFSLLMLHGYMQWVGLYGKKYRSSVGAVWYAVGAVAGIGTGWAAVIMAGLIWLWHAGRMTAGQRRRGMLPWLTLIPLLALTAVVLHILWARDWDAGLFGPLLWSRTLGPDGAEPISWTQWCVRQGAYLRGNFTLIGVGGTIAYLLIAPTVRWLAHPESPLRRALPGKALLLPSILLAAQGIIYVVAFKNRSWIHNYWQFLLTPFAALALAALALAVYALLARLWSKAAVVVLLLLMLPPMWAFARGLNAYHQYPRFLPEYVEVLAQLDRLVSPRVPVLTSWRLSDNTESFGDYTNRWPVPQIAYYANRPLIHSEDLGEILANQQGCAAYIWTISHDPDKSRLAQALVDRFETVMIEDHHLIVLLRRLKPGGVPK